MVIGIDCSRALGKERTGTENYSYYLIREMLGLPEAKKHRFVLYIRANVLIPEFMKRKGIIIRVISNKYLWTQVGLAWETWRDELEVLFVPAHTLPIWRKPGIKTVVTIHGLEYKWLPEYQNWLQRWYLPLSTYYAAKRANKLIAVSQFTRLQLMNELGIPAKKISVIYEGVRLKSEIRNPKLEAKQKSEIRNKTKHKYGIKDQEYILFVGTLQPRKNLPALIRAFGLVSARHGELKLVIVGGSGWLVKEIFLAVSRSPVVERIVFTGRVSEEELRELYRGAKLYVQPSFQEGFGLPILEAMNAGVPVVASDGGAIPEVVGKAGMIVNLGRGFEKRLAHAIEKAVSDEQWRIRARMNAKKWVGEFEWRKAAKETMKVLTN